MSVWTNSDKSKKLMNLKVGITHYTHENIKLVDSLKAKSTPPNNLLSIEADLCQAFAFLFFSSDFSAFIQVKLLNGFIFHDVDTFLHWRMRAS